MAQRKERRRLSDAQTQFIKEQQGKEVSVDTWRKPGLVPLMMEELTPDDPEHFLAVRMPSKEVMTVLYDDFRRIPDHYKPKDWLKVMPDPTTYEKNVRALKYHLVYRILMNAYQKEIELGDGTVRKLDTFL